MFLASGCGAVLSTMFNLLGERGDSVLIPAPYYPGFDFDTQVGLRLSRRAYLLRLRTDLGLSQPASLVEQPSQTCDLCKVLVRAWARATPVKLVAGLCRTWSSNYMHASNCSARRRARG